MTTRLPYIVQLCITQVMLMSNDSLLGLLCELQEMKECSTTCFGTESDSIITNYFKKRWTEGLGNGHLGQTQILVLFFFDLIRDNLWPSFTSTLIVNTCYNDGLTCAGVSRMILDLKSCRSTAEVLQHKQTTDGRNIESWLTACSWPERKNRYSAWNAVM